MDRAQLVEIALLGPDYFGSRWGQHQAECQFCRPDTPHPYCQPGMVMLLVWLDASWRQRQLQVEVDEAADGALGRLFQEYGPPRQRRVLPRRGK